MRRGKSSGTIRASFDYELSKGREFEQKVLDWFRASGWLGGMLPHDHLGQPGPDLEVFNGGRTYFVECKAKAPMKCCPATGFAEKYLPYYLCVQQASGLPVLIVWLDPTTGTSYMTSLARLMAHYVYQRKHVANSGGPVVLFKFPSAAFVPFDLESDCPQDVIRRAMDDSQDGLIP